MMKKCRAVYAHIPFCRMICSYCDFCKMFYNEGLVDKYLDVLDMEIDKFYMGEEAQTIYIGGGTPSSLSIHQLERLFTILKKINQNKLKEFTIEVNPEDIDEDKLKLFKKYGVNRISIGHQTKFQKYQDELGRNSSITKEKIGLVKKYFSNISIDLMYGFHDQTEEELKEDIKYILSLDVSHISCYSLILEEHTKLFIQKYERLDDDQDARFYQILCSMLNEFGYQHYEISNFSKPGYQSRHNLVYWHNEKYYGFGLGASGYLDTRYTNTRSINSYLKGNYRYSEEEVTKDDLMVYEMILGLRLVKGVSKKFFFRKFGCMVEQSFDIIDLLNQGLLEDDGENYRIPQDKLYLENSILIHFLEVKHEEGSI